MVATKRTMNAPRDVEKVDPRFRPVVRAFESDPHVTRGMMMSSYGLKVGGKIFAMFGRGKFVVKLPKGRVDALVAAGKGSRFEPGPGRVMKEWIAFTDGDRGWATLAREAYDFVSSVPKKK
jgi:TfoX/Sxy family transcriptional regulator of competence genes